MAYYILKRLLLMIPTLFGVMLVTFIVTQFVPGGPVEQVMGQLKHSQSAGEASGGKTALYRGREGLDDKLIKELQSYYHLDEPAHWGQFFSSSSGVRPCGIETSGFH